jgi:hypothetical protein
MSDNGSDSEEDLFKILATQKTKRIRVGMKEISRRNKAAKVSSALKNVDAKKKVEGKMTGAAIATAGADAAAAMEMICAGVIFLQCAS